MTLVIMGKLSVNISGCSIIEKSVELDTGVQIIQGREIEKGTILSEAQDIDPIGKVRRNRK